jgi:hypothetical protein
VEIEQLVSGDRVISPGGTTLAVKWVGWRHLDIARSSERHRLWPIRIERGAIADDVPRRDLYVSPDHALYLDGLLIPAAALLNGTTITQCQQVSQITYHHIELERHGIVLAEGAAAESYMDTGNRAFFANAPDATELRPVLPGLSTLGLPKRLRRALASLSAARFYHRQAAAPWADSGRAVARIRRALAARAPALGYRLSRDPDLALMADGRLIRPSTIEVGRACFTIPAGTKRLRLLSRSAAMEVASPVIDRRRLGVAIVRITFEANGTRRVVRATDASLCVGFYAAERRLWRTWRWTDGAAELPHQPTEHPIMLELRLRSDTTYWLAPAAAAPEARRG